MRLRSVLTVAAAALLVLLAVGCKNDGDGGGGDGLTLEGYFQELEALATVLDEDSNTLDSELTAADTVEEARVVLARFPGVLQAFLDDLDAIDPPAEAADAQNDAVEKGTAFLAEFQSAIDSAGDATTFDELFAATQGEAFTTASDAFTATCLTLTGIATDNGITVDLGCEE